MPRSCKPTARGFTLIELMIVILVIVVLLAIAVPQWIRARESARSKACCQTLKEIHTAKEQWGMVNRTLPNATPSAADLVAEYMKGSEDTLPSCPTGGEYTLNDLRSPPECSTGANSDAATWDDHILH